MNSMVHSRAQWREVVGSLCVRVPVWVLLEHHIFFDDKVLNTVPIRSVIVNGDESCLICQFETRKQFANM